MTTRFIASQHPSLAVIYLTVKRERKNGRLEKGTCSRRSRISPAPKFFFRVFPFVLLLSGALRCAEILEQQPSSFSFIKRTPSTGSRKNPEFVQRTSHLAFGRASAHKKLSPMKVNTGRRRKQAGRLCKRENVLLICPQALIVFETHESVVFGKHVTNTGLREWRAQEEANKNLLNYSRAFLCRNLFFAACSIAR